MTTTISQYTGQETLATLFASSARASVLRLFMLDPYRAYYQRQIENVTGLPIRAVQRELERLTGIGLFYARSEGNRMYYQVDTDFPLFPELQNMILKTGGDVEKLRGFASMERGIRLAIYDESDNSVLFVYEGSARLGRPAPGSFVIELMTSEQFVDGLSARNERLARRLENGIDLLGRRDDLIWRRIESAGFDVAKGKGVA